MKTQDDCKTPRRHRQHLCKLLQQGEMQEFDRRRSAPQVICCRCGLSANDAEDVCQPRPL